MEPVKEKKKKHGLPKILLTILIIILFSIGAAAFVFREEIMILYKAITTSPESVASQQLENDRKTQELLNSVVEVTMHDLSEEERKMLADGLLTPEQAMAIILGRPLPSVTTAVFDDIETVAVTDTAEPNDKDPSYVTSAPTPPEGTDAPEETTSETTASATTEATTAETTTVTTTVATTEEVYIDPVWGKARIEEIIAEIYLLRATYLNEIDKLIADGKKEYIDLPKGQHTLTNKFTIIERMLADGEKLEKQCDASMDKLLAELEKILKGLDSPTDIIKEIRATYAEQKQLKKTELYNQYAPKLMK